MNRLVSAFTSDADDGVAPCDDGYHATGVGPYSLSYTYNKIGNVTKVVDEVASQTVNYSYGASGAGPHAVTSAGGVSYGYDANGNMVSRDGDGLTFNQRNRLVAYQAGAGGETRFVYDADGNRIQRRAPEGTTDDPNRVGTGTTADAVRNELATELPTGGKFPSKKAQIYINGLNKVLKQDLTANDRLVAQSLLDDLVSALGGAP